MLYIYGCSERNVVLYGLDMKYSLLTNMEILADLCNKFGYSFCANSTWEWEHDVRTGFMYSFNNKNDAFWAWLVLI